MQNPSYLIRSRHAIFYFRYPLAQYDNKRVSISLDTRCPKEALRLSKALEYHAFMILNDPKTKSMDYREVKEMLRAHFAEVLERMKRSIDKDGPLSEARVKMYQDLQALAEEAIQEQRDELYGDLVSDEMPEELSLDHALAPIIERYGVNPDKECKEYIALRKEYRHALNGYISALLSYNMNNSFYSFENKEKKSTGKPYVTRAELKLSHVLETYLKEYEGKIGARGYNEKKDCCSYLLEVFGDDVLITDIENDEARKVRRLLQETPANRRKLPETRGKPLSVQIETLKAHGLEPLSGSSVNKYLRYMSSLFLWAKKNKYVSENPFEKMGVRVKKKDGRRDAFSKDEVKTIMQAVSELKDGNGKEKTRYWGAMLAIYTGARLNEFCALTVDDVKQDKTSGIWYLEISDVVEEGKQVKSEAANRIIPIHSDLIRLGFLEYVQHAKGVVAKKPKSGEYKTRLLYDLTYRDGSQWGRKIGRWFNERFLPELGLKTDKKTLHSLRHSFITSLSAAGVQGGYIKSMVGHEQGTVTEKNYTHYGVDHLPVFKEAIEKLGY